MNHQSPLLRTTHTTLNSLHSFLRTTTTQAVKTINLKLQVKAKVLWEAFGAVMPHGSVLHWTEALGAKTRHCRRRLKPPLAKPVKLQTHQSQHAYFSVRHSGPTKPKCLFFLSLSPHVLFMGRPLAPSESLVKSSEGFLSSFSHSSFSALTEHIIWTLIERNFLLGRTTQQPLSWLPFPYYFLYSVYIYICIAWE